MSAFHIAAWLAGAASFWLPHVTSAQCVSDGPCGRNASSLYLQVENDVFSGSKQDQGYSSGVKIGWVSADLAGRADCPSTAVCSLHNALSWLQPGGETQNMVMALEHMLFTPRDKRRDLIVTDRPYAATLTLTLGYQARRDARLRSNLLTIGVVGPAALGRPMQNGMHSILNNARFQGWHNQLKNEPILQWAHEDRTRWVGAQTRTAWRGDAIAYWGGTVGNLATHLNAGGELRYGLRLPDDFGSGRLAGVNTARSDAGTSASGWAAHAFLALDTRLIARDLTLDGSTWRHRHKVDKRHVVAELGYGLAFRYARWNVTLARYHRTREFNGQTQRPVFGGVRVWYRF